MPQQRQRNIRMFAFYAALACISLAAFQAGESKYRPERDGIIVGGFLLAVASVAMIGATMGWICGRAVLGALIGVALFACLFWMAPYLALWALHRYVI